MNTYDHTITCIIGVLVYLPSKYAVIDFFIINEWKKNRNKNSLPKLHIPSELINARIR